MTTDELLNTLPAFVGKNPIYDKNGKIICYIANNASEIALGYLYLVNEGSYWKACYTYDSIIIFYLKNTDSACFYDKSVNGALQQLYDWCVRNGFIKA